MRPWPALRAFLITAAMIIGLVDGCPLRGLRVSDEDQPELADAVDSISRAQQRFMRPVRFIGDDLKLTQRWKLFPVANRDRYRMWIEARPVRDAPWQLLYRSHDDAHMWLDDELEYRRMRGGWNPGTKRVRGAYKHFVTWVARTTFARDPAWAELRVRMEVLDIRPREGSMHPTGRFKFEEVRRRTELER